MSPPVRQPLTAADRLRKLQAMSAGELWTRIRYRAYCEWERRQYRRGPLGAGVSLRKALVPALGQLAGWRKALVGARKARHARFFAGAEQLDATRALLLASYPAEREQARIEADRALRREFSFFGGTYSYRDRVRWHADPVTGAEWPRVYHRSVPVHGGDVGFGDVKHVWELGRHQFLIDLAKGWAIEREPRYSAAMRALVFDWRAENPVGTGVGWSCALEPAFRVLSWLWAYYLTLDDPAFDDEAHVRWLHGFHDHGWFLYRHLEYYSSPFNHLIGEACALYSLGVLFPEFAEAPAWRAHGRHVMESRLPSQFYRDGGSVEQSTFYHHATTGFYLLAATLGRANGEEFSPAVWSAIERALEFSARLQQPDGTTPRVGGADDGKPIRLEQLRLWDFRPYQSIGAVLFNRGDFKAAAGRFFEDGLWLLGPDGASQFEALPAQEPAPASHAFEASGYVVIRDRWSPDSNYLLFDCGEQAAGLRRDAIPSAAHGHADCLSVIVWRRGQPVLVDAGFHCYNGPKAWQDHFRETAAHNTIRIDGADQALHINKMAWSHTYAARLDGCDIAGPEGWAVGSHDGYRRLSSGAVTHRRAVWARGRGYVVIWDRLEGAGTHDVELNFQFAPGKLAAGSGSASFQDRVDLHWCAPVDLRASIQEGGPAPDGGWVAPSLGVKTAAPRLTLAGRLTVPATIVTILADRTTRALTVASRDGVITVSGDGWTDHITAGGWTPADAPFESDAPLAAWTDRNGQIVADGRTGGTYQRTSDR